MKGFAGALRDRIKKVIEYENEIPIPPTGYKTAEEQYPELNDIAKYVELTTICLISKEKRRLLKGKGTKCPYPAQCILEMVIKKLEEVV